MMQPTGEASNMGQQDALAILCEVHQHGNPAVIATRRQGDPARLIATDMEQINGDTWRPKDLKSALTFEQESV